MDIQTEILVIGAGPSAASFAELGANGKKITVISETRIDDALCLVAWQIRLDKFWKLANSQRF